MAKRFTVAFVCAVDRCIAAGAVCLCFVCVLIALAHKSQHKYEAKKEFLASERGIAAVKGWLGVALTAFGCTSSRASAI